jgi:hypothetical protein
LAPLCVMHLGGEQINSKLLEWHYLLTN